MRKVGIALFIAVALAALPSCLSGKGPAPQPSPPGAEGIKPAASLWASAADGDTLNLSGKVRRVGSDPFSRLVLTDSDDNDWQLDGPAEALLSGYEQKDVKVRAKIKLEAQVLADGRRLPDKRRLTELSIIE